MAKVLRLEIPVHFKDGREILPGSVFHWNQEKKCYELKLKNQPIVIIADKTANQFPEFFNKFENE